MMPEVVRERYTQVMQMMVEVVDLMFLVASLPSHPKMDEEKLVV